MIKKGDKVIMKQGKDRSKTGSVLSILVSSRVDRAARVVVEGLNTIKRHQKAKKQGQKGQILEKERSVDVSTVQVICPKCSKPTRVGHAKEGKNKKRVCKKCDNKF